MAKCLVIATTPSLRRRVAAELEEEGHVVVAARSSREGADLADGVAFDLILLELRAATEGDVETVTRMIGRRPRVPILTMSGEAASRAAILALDADEHLASVFDPVERRAKIEDLLRRRERRKVRSLASRMRWRRRN